MDYGDKELEDFIKRGDLKIANKTDNSQLIKKLFENPPSLVKKFISLSKAITHQYEHDLDLNLIFRFYRSIDYHKLDDVLSKSIHASILVLKNPEKAQQFVAKVQNLKYFFIIMLWDKLFLHQKYNRILIDFEIVIVQNDKLKMMLEKWSETLPKQYLKLLVTQLQMILEKDIVKLQPANMEDQNIRQVNTNIEATCTFMKILYQSNQKNPRIKNQKFAKKNLIDHFRPIDIFKLHIKKVVPLNFTRYAFLLDLDYKYKLLQIQSVYEQKVNMEKSLSSGIHNLMNGMIQLDANGNLSLESLVFLHFQINRHNILDDSMEKLGRIKHNLKSPMKIKFLGEEGADQGGVLNEYFQLVTKQIFNPYLDMFLPKNSGRVYWFNGFSYEPPIRFQFVGMLFGLAIYNQVHLDVRFPRILYKRLLFGLADQISQTTEQLIQDLQEIQPDIHRSLKQILESQGNLDQLELYFNIQLQNFGQKIYEELVEDGNSIKLNEDNKYEYCYLYTDFLLNKQVQKQLKAFKKGFDRVCNTSLIKMFTPGQLEVIICGNEVVDFSQLEAHTKYEGGYTKDTPVIKNLWEILKDLSLEDKKGFLFFCTGSDRVPLDGFKSMNFLIQRHANQESLPTAHTCFNVFLLPEYESREKLEKNIDFIIKNNQGFGLI